MVPDGWSSADRPQADLWTCAEDITMEVRAQLDMVGELALGVTSQMGSSQSSSDDDLDSAEEGTPDMDWTENPLSLRRSHLQDPGEGDQTEEHTGLLMRATPELRKPHQQVGRRSAEACDRMHVLICNMSRKAASWFQK